MKNIILSWRTIFSRRATLQLLGGSKAFTIGFPYNTDRQITVMSQRKTNGKALEPPKSCNVALREKIVLRDKIIFFIQVFFCDLEISPSARKSGLYL